MAYRIIEKVTIQNFWAYSDSKINSLSPLSVPFTGLVKIWYVKKKARGAKGLVQMF